MSKFSEKFKAFFIKNGKEKALLTKQAIAIFVCLAVFAAGIAVYFIWAKPAEQTAGKPEYMYDGESFIDSTGVLLMFPQYSRNDIESISISNSLEKYKLNAYVEEGYSRYVVGDDILYIKTSSLLDIANDTEHKLDKSSGLASYLVKDGITKDGLAEYGIDLDSDKTIKVEDNGTKHVFLLGTRTELSSGASYYIIYSPEDKTDEYAIYTVITLSSSTQFRIENFESTKLDETNVAAVVVASTVVPTVSPSTKTFRVTENATYSELAQYGLDDESSPAKVTVSLINGSEYTFYLGSKIPSGGGYYARVEGRMNDGGYIVYIIGNTTANTFLCESSALLDTLVVTAVGSDAEGITDFRLYRIAGNDSVRSLVMQAAAATESTKTADTSAYTMVYPTAYSLDEDQYYNNVISSITYITANSVVSFGDRIHSENIYTKYGLDLDKERLSDGTDKNHAKIMFASIESPTEEDYSIIYFSERMTATDGTYFYYVYSPEFEAIYKLSAEGFDFIDWPLAHFTRGSLYFNYINCTDYFELISDRTGTSVRYTMSGGEKTLKAIVTEAGENGKQLTRTDSEGKTVPGEFKVEYTSKVLGTYTTTEFSGDFEEFRSLFYILITRALSLDADSAGLNVAEKPSYTIKIADTANDQPMSYARYDKSGNKVYYTDSNGYQRAAQVRYAGGNIICNNIVVTSSDGTQLKYDTAYYDEAAGKFFLKVLSTNDSNLKPANYEYDSENNLVVSRYLPQNTVGEYVQTTYEHNIYDIYNIYTDANGKTVRQINQTYKYSVPTTTTRTYRIEADGTRTLLSEKTENAQNGVLIRTQIVEKLFSDSDKLLSGVKIDREGIN